MYSLSPNQPLAFVIDRFVGESLRIWLGCVFTFVSKFRVYRRLFTSITSTNYIENYVTWPPSFKPCITQRRKFVRYILSNRYYGERQDQHTSLMHYNSCIRYWLASVMRCSFIPYQRKHSTTISLYLNKLENCVRGFEFPVSGVPCCYPESITF